ncbi:hypothetical protein ACFV7Q_24935 [Streptomyces sp. NPDC059851]|uniref:hypothetical protein n=1 Tax=Streptomyces sp. NPDC059851 TaxID=3346971 RepID=UPI003650A2F3
MTVLDILAGLAKTGRWGPVAIGADVNELVAAFGEPWDAGSMSRSRQWPRLFTYGDLELSVCRCRRVNLICVQAWRDAIALPSSAAGRTRSHPAALTYGDVARALDRADCAWEPQASLTFGTQSALMALPSRASFVFETFEDEDEDDTGDAGGEEPILHTMGLPGDHHTCPA